MPAPAITILGSVNMDLVVNTPELPQPGQTLLGSKFSTIPGGKGANQAIAAARAGGPVSFLGAVGTDEFGAALRANLAAADVNVSFLRQVPGPSGIAAITVNSAAENTIIVVPGANGELLGLRREEFALITGSEMLVCQLEVPVETVLAGVRAAAATGVPVLLNPSPVQELPAELLAGVTILVVNEGEAAALGEEVLAGIPHVITTLGAAGAAYRGPDGLAFAVGAPVVKAVDTTGAGDTFAGALAVAWTEGQSAEEAVQFACSAGALATTVAGASVSAPSRDRIEDLAAQTYPGRLVRAPRTLAATPGNPAAGSREKFEELASRKDYADIRRVLAGYVEAALPDAAGSESLTWAVTPMAENNRSDKERQLISLHTGPAETLVLVEVGQEEKGTIIGFLNVAEPAKFNAFSKTMRRVGVRALKISDRHLGDAVQLNFESLAGLQAILDDAEAIALATSWAGSSIAAGGVPAQTIHSYDLAADFLR